MQQVMFAWLVVEVLHEDASRVGTAQMVGTLPSVVFLLLGGALADRLERRQTLLITHVGGALSSLGLVALMAGGELRYGVVLVYAAVWGTLHAIHMPARDAMLFDVGQRALSRAVSGTTVVQFGGQALGNLLVGTAAWLGAPLVLGLQSLISLLGAGPTWRLPRGRPASPFGGAHEPALRQIRDGLRIVARSSQLRSLTLLISFNGVFFIGPYFVLVPLQLRDAYGGGVAELSLLMMMFPLGTISASTLLLYLGRVPHRGKIHLAGQMLGALCLLAIGSVPPFPWLLLLSFVWGLGGGAFLNTGRMLFLEAAPESHRGRALSVYTLALMGMAPIGTQLAGLLGEAIGAATACTLAGACMIALVAVSWFAMPVRTFD
jgi:MFS family permease